MRPPRSGQHSGSRDDSERERQQQVRPAPPAARRVAGPAPAGGTGPGEALSLQRTVGNRETARLIEQERHTHGAGCGHDVPAVQRSTAPEVLRGGGRPLDEAVRADMEARLGADFSDVRVHDDAAARTSAAELGARAYTSGSHVVLGEGGGDRRTLAHELTHVVQQRLGPVAGTDDGSGLRVSDPDDRFEREAEATASRVMAGDAVHLGGAAATGAVAAGGPATVSRSADAAGPIQRWYTGEDHARLAGNRSPAYDERVRDATTQAAVADFVNGLTRNQLGWYEDTDSIPGTRQALMDASPSRTTTDPWTDQIIQMWQCASCRNGVGYAGVDLGHKVDWRAYLHTKGVLNLAEARAAYNDLDNLQIECATCNRSHDFERNSQGSFRDGGAAYSSERSSDRDFVVSDSASLSGGSATGTPPRTGSPMDEG
ncbi:DUF4157 domain-containing protein [Micromonospora sp. WMMD712]|uniref:eCIS core domain-containing protein n=1 Tax=Micromonospora sp. WMMD712 TaxID=3016096 RepID=UPI002499FF6E|nr:DUF4157 domain-containing protein [Micromonospora sp. WMMD712]WFE58493.1 DUF4157 domain-containing protein [Micromonospora sp. WMMD712]